MSVEAISDWGTCFATASDSRDPNRIHWIMEVLMEEPIRSKGSFIDSSRLYALQGGIAQQEWRIGELCHRLVEFLKPFLTHPYKNVRDRLGSVLANIYMSDLEFVNTNTINGMDSDKLCHEPSNIRNPRVADFINEVLPQLEIMSQEPEEQLSMEERQSMMPTTNGASLVPFKPKDMMKMLNGIPGENSGTLTIGSQRTENVLPESFVSALLAKNNTITDGMVSAEMESLLKSAGRQLGGVDFLPSPTLESSALLNLNPGGLGVSSSKSSQEFEKRQVAIRLLQTG